MIPHQSNSTPTKHHKNQLLIESVKGVTQKATTIEGANCDVWSRGKPYQLN
jgi:hypothetical protein